MSTSHNNDRNHPRHLEFEPNNHSGSNQSTDRSSSPASADRGSSYYDSHYGSDYAGTQRGSSRSGARNSSYGSSRGNTGTWVGAGLAVLAAGAFIGLTRNKWSSWGSSISDVAGRSGSWLSGLTGKKEGADQNSGSQASSQSDVLAQAGQSSAQSGATAQAGQSGRAGRAGQSSSAGQVDASLNSEVSRKGTKPSPSSAKNFTDEGATGNND